MPAHVTPPSIGFMDAQVSIRAITPGDSGALEDFYLRLSPESRRRRFLGVSRGISAAQARRFATAASRGAAGFVAVRGSRIIGHACVELCDADAVEMAFAVDDAWQRRGIGRRLLQRALAWTNRRGIGRIDLSLFADNAAMRGLLRSIPGSVDVRPEGSVEQVELVLPVAA
jgi:GNAT superfamily N-acetyltransferase